MVLLSSSLLKSSAGHCPYLTNKMSMLYVLAKDINPQCYKKAIRLRLIRTYIVTEGRNKSAVKSQECLFHDIEFSHLLKEGKVYAVKNFVAVSYYYQYKTTQHKYMMRFNQYTTIGFPTQLVDFLIEDSKGNRIKCTLWDEHVPAVMPFFNNHTDGHLIVLLQLCRAKTVDNEVRISSSYTATKVLFNLDCQEFADFRNSLKANCSPLRSISVVSYGHSANNSQSPMVVSTIRDLYERAEEGYYYVPGTIVSTESILLNTSTVENDVEEWEMRSGFPAHTLLQRFYSIWTAKSFADFRNSANNSQSPMVVSTIRDLYERAETNWAEGNVRYKLVVRVLDKTSDAPFVLWDKDCFELLGITAYDLKFKYSMSKMQVPVEFEQLRNKSMVFRINLKSEHIRNPAKPIPVLSVIRNEELEGDEAISPIVQANLKLKGVATDQDEVDTGAIKRCLLDQFSSSQNLKKCKALVIKEEKTL
nr:replication protein A 70 kDa DNA-binding subunit B-like [Ipomoea batatas]